MSKRFCQYSEFIKDFFGAGHKAGEDSAGVFIRSWRNQVNILHVNTALYSTDHNSKEVQGLDTIALSKIALTEKFRTVILPPPVDEALRAYKQTVSSQWIFPSPKKEDAPLAPAAASHRLAKTLGHAGCKKVRFHDLRHVFTANALKHGMDVKTLSTIIGHVSSATTLNIYARVTDDMRRQAAAKIDQGIGRAETSSECPAATASHAMTDFKPKRGRNRYWGSGYPAGAIFSVCGQICGQRAVSSNGHIKIVIVKANLKTISGYSRGRNAPESIHECVRW